MFDTVENFLIDPYLENKDICNQTNENGWK